MYFYLGTIMLILPVLEKYFMAHGALYAVIMQVLRPIKMGMSDIKELLIYLMPIPGWIMMAISFKGTHWSITCYQTNTNHQVVDGVVW